MFIIPWVALRFLYEDIICWTSSITRIYLLITVPIALSVIVSGYENNLFSCKLCFLYCVVDKFLLVFDVSKGSLCQIKFHVHSATEIEIQVSYMKWNKNYHNFCLIFLGS